MCQNKYNYKKIGETIKEIRKNAKLSQDEFIEAANLTGTQRKRLGKIERGDEDAVGKLDLDFFVHVADFAGCSVGHILGEYNCATREIEDIHEVTGLSENAITSLIEMKEDENLVDDFLSCDAMSYNDFLKVTDKYGKRDRLDREFEIVAENYRRIIKQLPEEDTLSKEYKRRIDTKDYIEIYGSLLEKIIVGDNSEPYTMSVDINGNLSHPFDHYNPITVRYMTLDYILSSRGVIGFLPSFYLLDVISETIFRVRERRNYMYLQYGEKEIRAVQMFKLQEEILKAIRDNREVDIINHREEEHNAE